MKKIAIAAAVALMAAGCAHKPQMAQPQVNRTAKSDKGDYTKSAKVVQPAEMPTPNQTVKKRWFEGFKIRLLHK